MCSQVYPCAATHTLIDMVTTLAARVMNSIDHTVGTIGEGFVAYIDCIVVALLKGCAPFGNTRVIDCRYAASCAACTICKGIFARKVCRLAVCKAILNALPAIFTYLFGVIFTIVVNDNFGYRLFLFGILGIRKKKRVYFRMINFI